MAPLEVGAQLSLRAGAKALATRRLDVHVEGLEHLPRRGPVVIASRHAHHLYDGCLLLAVTPRPLHLLVALDWVTTPRGRRAMEWACRTARWPVVLRAEMLRQPGHSAYTSGDTARYLRRAVRNAVALLNEERALVVFPEAYPTIDPHAPRADGDSLLPFRPGFIRVVEIAQRDSRLRIPIVPAGIRYRPGRRWQATLRFAAPLYTDGRADRTRVMHAVEDQVRLLSMAESMQPRASSYEMSAVGDD